MSSVIMSGALSNFDVPSILQAVSLSRQCTLLRLWDRNKRETGEIRIKAGQLLDATCGPKRGRAALHTLLHGKHHSFRVERFADPVNLPEPVGPLAALLLEMPHPVAVPPPPPPQVAPEPTPLRMAPPSVSLVVAPLTDEAARQFAALAAVDRVLVCQRPDAVRCWEWARGTSSVATETLQSIVGMLMGARGFALPPSTLLQLSEATVVVRPVNGDFVAAYAFPPATPLGMVRMVVGAAQPIAGAGSDR